MSILNFNLLNYEVRSLHFPIVKFYELLKSMKSKILSVIGQKCTEKFDPTCTYFGPWVYPRGSYLITHVRPSVVRGTLVRL